MMASMVSGLGWFMADRFGRVVNEIGSLKADLRFQAALGVNLNEAA